MNTAFHILHSYESKRLFGNVGNITECKYMSIIIVNLIEHVYTPVTYFKQNINKPY